MTVDLNCDMGEGVGNDSEIMPFISSANIACGYHAGNHSTIYETTRLALQYNVAVGAHPSFPDRENFGRTPMNFRSQEIYEMIFKQLEIVNEVVESLGGKLNHVKPHGALYNMAAVDGELAKVIASAVKDYDPNLTLFGLANGLMFEAAKVSGLKFKHEVFADRTYQDDGALTSRLQPNALITDEEECLKQVLEMVKNKMVTSLNGKKIPIHPDTICIHGDGEHAVQFARLLNLKLGEEGIKISSQ